jgi:hypothetical protein
VYYAVIAILVLLTWIPIRLLAMDSISNKDMLIRLAPIGFSLALSVFFMMRNFKKNTLVKLLPLYAGMVLYFLLLPVRKDS